MKQQQKTAGCPVEVTLSIVGGKWKLQIVYCLLNGTKRFGELRRLIPATTQQMLTLQLRELEQAGIIHRKVYAQVPQRWNTHSPSRGEAWNQSSTRFTPGESGTASKTTSSIGS
ncbi:hypothetical protein KSC_088810 [Ktedonobacter sp. SOSP1-52]|nr:hypothetical protein KSC_088810 [Ktedonobacter sp. SOSP1-52]